MDRVVRQQAISAHQISHSGAADLRREFWQAFKHFMERSGSAVECARVTSDGWMWHSSDLSFGKLLSMVRVRLGEIGVKYTLDDLAAGTVFRLLRANRKTVDGAFGEAPAWRDSGDNSHVIELRRPASVSVKEDWLAHSEWLQRQLETFRHALAPLVGRMPPSTDERDWDQCSFLRELARYNPNTVETIRAILDWTSAHNAAVTWASGRRCGSFAVTVSHRGFLHHPVHLRADGVLSIQFTQLRNSPIFWDNRLRVELLERINRIEHVVLPAAAVEHRPCLPIAVLAGEAALAQFLDVLEWFAGTVRSV